MVGYETDCRSTSTVLTRTEAKNEPHQCTDREWSGVMLVFGSFPGHCNKQAVHEFRYPRLVTKSLLFIAVLLLMTFVFLSIYKYIHIGVDR
jgi:heme/copper-type cytochrome/quinol oxidase subunit 3